MSSTRCLKLSPPRQCSTQSSQEIFRALMRKLMKQVTEISLCLVRFCDGCLMLMTDSYFGRDRQSLNPEEIELPNPPSRNEIEVPFFSE